MSLVVAQPAPPPATTLAPPPEPTVVDVEQAKSWAPAAAKVACDNLPAEPSAAPVEVAAAAHTGTASDQNAAKPEQEQLPATTTSTDQPPASAPPAYQQPAAPAKARSARPHPAVAALAPPAYMPADPSAMDKLDVSTSFALAAAKGMAEAQDGEGGTGTTASGRKRREVQMPAKYRDDTIDGKKVDQTHQQERRSIKRAKTR
jgi:hypothetical protein